MSLFENSKTQYIDMNGKTRIINFDELSLAVSPLPPLVNKKEVPLKNTKITNIEKAIEFIKKYNLKITEQDGDEINKSIQGLWIKSTDQPPEFVFGYIPLEQSSSLDNIPFSDPEITDPIFVGESLY
jgi:hypothetical protein